MKILITDVSHNSTDLMKEMVDVLGLSFEVDTANSDAAVLELLKRRQYQVVIGGVSGNESYNGMKIFRAARKVNPDVILVLASGYSREICEDNLDGEDIKINAVWEKVSINARTIEGMIENLLPQGQKGDWTEIPEMGEGESSIA